ncbi:MAG: PQQ-dependent sugar dehydrogenase [Gemmatimonadaceae bacterium]|nr:PQQ-dependent sugar dehydrogenase [Gemmatimonadaceae bacterium]
MPSRAARALVAAGLAATFAAPRPAPLAAQDVEKSKLHDFRIVTVVDGLLSPWGMAFLPGGDILVTQRGGELRLIRGGKLLPTPVPGVPAVRALGQGGLLDIVAHPRFAQNHLVYLSYSKPLEDGRQGQTAVMRARFENDRLVDGQDIFLAKNVSTGRGHYGSRLAFDRDGYLFITLGDRQVPPTGDLERHPAQDLSTHHGKTIRLKDDGSVPADNPFVNTPGALPEIWSYGHRNMQGAVIHPVTNQLWTVEHGPQGGDELNLDQAGKNYGWPVIGFGVNYGPGMAIHASTTRQGMEQPVNVWVPSIAVQDLLVYTGDRFPDWKGSFFVGSLAGQKLVRIALDGTTVLDVENLVQRRGRIRAIEQGPDGFLYLAFEGENGATSKLVRLEPVPRR